MGWDGEGGWRRAARPSTYGEREPALCYSPALHSWSEVGKEGKKELISGNGVIRIFSSSNTQHSPGESIGLTPQSRTCQPLAPGGLSHCPPQLSPAKQRESARLWSPGGRDSHKKHPCEFRKIVTITLYARQQKRHRCIEQSFGLCGRG